MTQQQKQETDVEAVEAALAAARPFLRADYPKIDPALPGLVQVLRDNGASECWHKHGTFLEHLQDVYRILKLWGAPDAVARCGLFHSAYSNSYVNLAIFQPDVQREDVRRLIGAEAEHLVHMFCIVPRHQLIHDMLLHRFTDQQLVDALHNGQDEQLSRILPREGLKVAHIRTGEDILVPRRLVAIFLLLTMADFIDQLKGWQDVIFGNNDGNLMWDGNHARTALWPGNGKPGLWITAVSRMGVLLNLILRQINAEEGQSANGNGSCRPEDEIPLVTLPPVFDGCSRILYPEDQIKSRDAYWEVVQFSTPDLESKKVHTDVEEDLQLRQQETLLVGACEVNPWVAEPHVLLAQIHLAQRRFDEAKIEARKGLLLLLQWGTQWDKRVSWEGWVSWARVLLAQAQANTWPQTGFGVLNLGLVK